MRTGLDFKSAQFDPVRGEAEDLKSNEDLKSSPVRNGGFGITSKTNELLIISSL